MSELRCPYCNGLNTDLNEYMLEDGQSKIIQCGHCDRPLDLYCSISVSYTFYIPTGELHPEDVADEAEGKVDA